MITPITGNEYKRPRRFRDALTVDGLSRLTRVRLRVTGL